MKGQDEFKKTITHRYENCIVRVHVPDLTEEERASRRKELKNAAERLMKQIERVKYEAKNESKAE